MGVSLLEVQRDAILGAIRDAGRGQWKLLVVDETSWKLVQGVVKEDDILSQKIMSTSKAPISFIRPCTQHPHKKTCAIFQITR